MKRRSFIHGATGTTAASILTTEYGLALDAHDHPSEIKVGIIADLHFGNFATDGIERFDVFSKVVATENPDHIIQLGDFCHPEPAAKKLLGKWHGVETNRYHVLGNHDMDKATKAEIQKFWGMKKRYYHFEQNGWRFVVMDMNHIKKGDDYIPNGNANFYVEPTMLTWADPDRDLVVAFLTTGKPILGTHIPALLRVVYDLNRLFPATSAPG